MKKIYFLILVAILLVNAKSFGQTTINNGDPLSNAAFDKNIMQDINFMVLGDNNPKQGFTYEYNEKKTELSLSGLLANRKSYILTIDGAFSVDDGAFVFDKKDGSKKGLVSLNLFVPVRFGNRKYYPAAKQDPLKDKKNLRSGETNRARYANYIAQVELPKKVLDTFRALDAIMEALELPQSGIENKKYGLFGIKLNLQHNLALVDNYKNMDAAKDLYDDEEKTVEKAKLMEFLLKYYTSPDPTAKFADYDSLLAAIKRGKYTTVIVQGQDNKSSLTYKIPEGLNIEKLYRDYDKIVDRAVNIDEEINDIQIKNFKDIWIIEQTTYFGFSPYYEKESLDIYSNSGTITEFSKRFIDTRGDIYGVKLGLNSVLRSQEGFFVMGRAIAEFGRASNFNDFQKKEYVYNSLPESIGIGVLVEEQKKTGYYTENGAPYSYGFLQNYSAELYCSFKVVGLYGKIGYSKNDALFKPETIPMETGVILNVKSEKKNVVSILFYVAREDLKVHPDKDTNFGFKIGLPINIKKNEPETDEKTK